MMQPSSLSASGREQISVPETNLKRVFVCARKFFHSICNSLKISLLPAILLLLAIADSSMVLKAEGSKDLYPSGAQGRRAYLQSRHESKTAATFNPFPNRGTHRVWVQAGETIYVGSSMQGLDLNGNTNTGTIILRTPNGNTYTSGTSTTVGLIANRTEELNGPDRTGVTTGYTPFTRVVQAGEAGIWEIDFVSMESTTTNSGGNGTNLTQHTGSGGDRLFDNDFSANFNWSGFGLNGQPNTENACALILAWDVSVGSAANAATLVNGRVFFTSLTLTLPNNYPTNGGFYGKTYVLTNEGYSYLLDNNNLNGASWSIFANNKGIVQGGTINVGGFTGGTQTYLSEDEVAIDASNTPHSHDPRIADGTGDFTFKQFYNKPASDLPSSASIRYYNTFSGGTAGTTTTTWLKNTPTPLSVSGYTVTDVVTGLPNRVGPSGATITFNTNIPGRYAFDIDGNDDGDFIDPIDRRILITAVNGFNSFIWDGKDGLGQQINSTLSPALRLEQNFLGEVHFPMVDVEINPNGLIIKRLNDSYEPISGQDKIFWNDQNIQNSTVTSNPPYPPNPVTNTVSGVSSTTNGHRFGAEIATAPHEGCTSCSATLNNGDGKEDFGNGKILDSWTWVSDLQVLTISVTPISGAALGIVKSSNLPNATPGSNGTYTITVTGGGTGIANNVTVTDVLPAGVSYVAQSTVATISTATQTTNRVRDEFSTQAYNNNNGTVNWSTNWTETGETTSATGGVITVSAANQNLSFTGTANNISINRGVNLNGVTSAVLSFNQNTTNLETGETISLQLSSDGGSNWNTITSFQGTTTLYTYNIPNTYYTTNARVRFLKNAWSGTFQDNATIDNVQVEYTIASTTSTSRNNGPGGTLASGLPATLITEADNIDLSPSSTLTITFNYTVGCTTGSTLVNTATANSVDLVNSVSATHTSNYATAAPNITSCPADINATPVPGSCNVTLTIPGIVANDDCGTPAITWLMTGATTGSGNGTIGSYTFLPGETSITYTATDNNGQTATCTFTVTVDPCADLVTVKTLQSADPTPAVGQSVQFLITVTNNGPDEASAVTLTDLLPTGITYTGHTASKGSYNNTTGVWNGFSMLPATQATLVLTGTINPGTGGSIITNNTTKATSPEHDPTDAGNDLTESVTVDLPIISGIVRNDTDGLTDNEIDGTGTNAGALNAVLVSGGLVVNAQSVAPDGTFSFINVTNGNYTILITTNTATIGQPAPSVNPPTGWANTGEYLGAGTGSDGTVNGQLSVTVSGSDVSNARFGIQQPPLTGSGSNTLLNPGGTNQVSVPASTFTNNAVSSDYAPGTVQQIRITAFPSGATTIVINGLPYNSGDFPVGGVLVNADASGNPTQTITVDPSFAGPGSVVIPFVAVDNAGMPSTNTAGGAGLATLNFNGQQISGIVVNDVTALTDNTVNGNGTNGGGLYAMLVDNGGTVYDFVSLPVSGIFNFTNVENGSYTVRLTNQLPVTGQPAPAVLLNTGWVSTGEFLGSGAGNDGSVNSILAITVNTANVSNAHLGIQQPPTAGGGITSVNLNPGGTVQENVPASTFTNITNSSDVGPGTVTSIRITAFPTGATTIVINGTPYGPGDLAALTSLIIPADANGNPTWSITADPSFDFNGQVSIPFKAIDNAGFESANTGTAILDFPGFMVTGTVYNDTDGLTDNEVDGSGTNGGGLNAILVDNLGNVAGSTNVSALGAFEFFGVPPGNYTVRITTNAGTIGQPAPAIVLPTGWVSTGEFLGTGAGDDGNVNSILSLTVVTANVSNVHLGMQQPPFAGNGANSAGNPGYDQQVDVPANTFANILASSDVAPGTLTSIRITAFPTGASSIVIEDANTGDFNIYYPTAGDLPVDCFYSNCLVWPSGGITVPVNAGGEPTVYFSVDPTAFGATQVIIPFVAIDNAGAESANTGQAVLDLYAVPDLTPVIDLPSNTFNPNQTNNVVLYVAEVNEVPTQAGVTAFGLTVPNGYEIEPYDGNMLNITPAGGFLTDVNNTQFEVVFYNATKTQIIFRAKPGIALTAYDLKAIGVRVTRKTALNGSVSNMTIGIFPDPLFEYDSDNLNNSFSRILNAQ